MRALDITDPYDRYFAKRADIIEELFQRDPSSIDGIALAMVSLNALAWYRYTSKAAPGKEKRGDQARFRRLPVEHCRSSFLNRMSIPELVRAIGGRHKLKRFEGAIKDRFPIIGMSFTRQPSEDPAIPVFDEWAKEQQLELPDDFPGCDYAGCITRHYRNSVIHQLRIAKGKDAGYFGESAHSTEIYYMNHRGRIGIEPEQDDEQAAIRFMNEDPVEYMRFGLKPMYLLKLLREAIESLRKWSLENDTHLFEDADE